jgi:hypothetical protein
MADELSKLGVLTRDDQLVSISVMPSTLNALVGKRVRLNCTVEYIREACYDDDGQEGAEGDVPAEQGDDCD